MVKNNNMKDLTYISIPKQQYERMEKNLKTLENKLKTFKEECSKDSKYIIISEKYDVLKHMEYLLVKNDKFLGCSQEDYVKTYEGTSYEEFLKEITDKIELTHGKILQEIKEYLLSKEIDKDKSTFNKWFQKFFGNKK